MIVVVRFAAWESGDLDAAECGIVARLTPASTRPSWRLGFYARGGACSDDSSLMPSSSSWTPLTDETATLRRPQPGRPAYGLTLFPVAKGSEHAHDHSWRGNVIPHAGPFPGY